MVRSKQNAIPIERLPQLKALISPVRQELVDTLQSLGTASITELAEQLGRPADGLYYHVRALVKAGLVVPAGARPQGGRSEALYRTSAPKHGLKLDFEQPGRGARQTLERLVASMLRTANRNFREALARPEVVVEGPERELWAARTKGWVTGGELRRANALLRELGDLMARQRSTRRDRLFSLSFVLAPARKRPARRS
jgi:DNA-binding transcriptional ArsR family regulator